MFWIDSTTDPPSQQDFVAIATDTGLIFPLFHRHMAYMLEGYLGKKRDRTYFNSLGSHAGVLDFLDDMGFREPGRTTGEIARLVDDYAALTFASLRTRDRNIGAVNYYVVCPVTSH